MDSWREHLLFHLIAFVVFTMPLTWFLYSFIFEQPFLPALPWIGLGAGVAVLMLGLMKFGLPRRSA